MLRRLLAVLSHLDAPLLTGLFLLAGVGLTVLYSAAGQEWAVVLRQGIRLVIGLGVLVILAQIPTRHLISWAPWLYLFITLMLVGVLLFGDIGKGARRWLDLGVVRFQPSEMMKLIMPIMLAWFMSQETWPVSWKRLIVGLGLIGLPAGLIMLQPDLGTALLVASSGVFVILLAGLSFRVIFYLFASGVAFILAALHTPVLSYVLHGYQLKRIHIFLNPEEEPLGAGYHIIQSKIAIGSGGLYGKGWLNGTQSHLEFLPERTTDFIFAVFSEEFGLIGIALLLLVYLFIITRGFIIAIQAQSAFDRLLAGSLTLTFFVYVFVNMGMVTGLLPVVGVPLPLVSYGGTSMVTLLAGFGILMAIYTHRQLPYR